MQTIANSTKLLFILLLVTSNLSIAQFNSYNVDFMSNWYNPNEPSNTNVGNTYSGMWAWHDSTKNKEYAIVGSATGTYFIDVSDPYNPIQKAFVKGHSTCTWREIKSYKHYAYVVSDVCTPNALQIIDMQYLPDSVHVVYDTDTLVRTAHTIFIDKDKMYLANPQGAHLSTINQTMSAFGVFSLANPERPTVLRLLNQDYPNVPIPYGHDMYVRNDTIYFSAATWGLHVFKQNIDNTLVEISQLTQYPGQGYNHSSWLTDNGKTLVMCDEVPEKLPVKILNVSDIHNIAVDSYFWSDSAATPHNPFVVGNDRVVLAYYMDGVQIYDISNPLQPTRTGYFDTYPQNGHSFTGGAYKGCWGTYPYLPSGNLLACDMRNGLFVLDARKALAIVGLEKVNKASSIYAYPNPATELVIITSKEEFIAKLTVYDILGNVCLSSNPNAQSDTLNLTQLSSGIYFIKADTKQNSTTIKIIKQ